MELKNGGNRSNTQYGVEKLVGTNYKYWRMCMEAFLQGQDLWDLVTGVDAEIPADIQENVEARRKWKIKCGKALFALRTSISKEFIDHVHDNDLASLTQGNMYISEYFLKVKSVCAEISELDIEEKISEARIRHFLIRGLKKEYFPFVTSIQGWAHQPSIEELESLLSNQEALAKQMTKSLDPEAVLFSKGKDYKKYAYHKSNKDETNKGKATINYSVQNQSVVKCYRCGKPGHIKKYCRVNLSKVNVASEKDDDDQIKWEQCFTVEVDEGPTQIQALSNTTKYKKEWIVDSAYHVEKEGDVQIGIDDINSVKLNDAFHVPGLKRNLVSVAQITDSGKYVIFGPKDVKVLDNMKNIFADMLTTREKKGMDEEPANFEEAKGCPEWESAMDEEIEALNNNQTWELVPKAENCKPVTCKWVYRLKRNSDGTIDRCKARLVAHGFSQSYGLDYEETYSSVAKMVTLRTIFSLAAMRGWKSWQLDVKNTFLYGELDREVFMEQPAGYVSDHYPYHVCHLKKSLYGIKQAPRAWYGKVA
ncbi:hypothetical protein GQ457_09G012020 [Hibiscus cannabinus]